MPKQVWISFDKQGVARGIFNTAIACKEDAVTYATESDTWTVCGPFVWQRPEPPVLQPGDEREIIDGIHKGAVVRIRERAEVSEVGVQMWRVDWSGVRPLVVRADFLGPRRERTMHTEVSDGDE